MQVHTDWSTPGFDLEPVAPRVGPFPKRGFLEAWHRVRGGGELMLVGGDGGLLALHADGGEVGFAGEADLTDYHTPLGPGAAALLAEFVSGLDPGTPLSFDSLPDEASAVVEDGLAAAGVDVTVVRTEAAVVLDLAATYADHLGALGAKERHEVRRKRRRFAEAYGEPRVVRDAAAFGWFVTMHRSADGEKGSFMTPDMEEFFAALLEIEGAALDVLVGGDGAPIAAAFGFEDDDTYYLYNSAFAPDAAYASPGIVLVDRLIETMITGGKTRFDFLKGEERYKMRLGGVIRPLSVVEGRR